jgi:TonB family protein
MNLNTPSIHNPHGAVGATHSDAWTRLAFLLLAFALVALLASCGTQTASPVKTRPTTALKGVPVMGARAMANHVNAMLAEPKNVAYFRLDAPLRVERAVPPLYPADARKRGAEGTVIVTMGVSETGDLTSVSTRRGSDDLLREAARFALSEWKFSPPMRGGKAVALTVDIPVIFSLHDTVKR